MKPLRIAASSFATATLALALLPVPADAATIVGGSDLLSPADAAQLEAWLGQGPLTLTNVFDKARGDDSVDFHAAADGKGATFSLVEVVGTWSEPFDEPVLIGGYNPQSWSSINTWNLTPDDADRTAFVFNLTQGLKLDQRKDAGSTNRGKFQTANYSSLGPYFGAGPDLRFNSTLDSGRSTLFSYGSDADLGLDLARYPHPYDDYLWFGRIEVFTISAVPEPGTWALMLAGVGLLGFAARRRA